DIHALSLHDALPICQFDLVRSSDQSYPDFAGAMGPTSLNSGPRRPGRTSKKTAALPRYRAALADCFLMSRSLIRTWTPRLLYVRSEEHTSELQSRFD